MLAYIHDPDARFLEDLAVMGDVATAMRDPIFYRWHCNIDNIFKKHKALMRQYNQQELDFSGVRVNSIEAKISSSRSQPNTLLTYWQKSDVDLAAGLDFGPNGNVFASFTHLQHAPFEYTINVTNSGGPRRGTARIFLCPKTDERGAPLSLNDVRQLAIEMDKFTVNLQAGPNMIKRRSDESTITIPFERSFRRVGAADTPQATDELSRFRFCGCGWPQHMLLPKGNEAGMQFDLYVMISDYTGDEVRQTNQGDVCGDASSFCGLKDQLYPDRRSMGFPFDRVLTGQNLSQFAQTYGNMSVSNLTIKFNDTIVDRT
ncbi:PPO1 family protein [Megaselia abdita]